jgi:hypothetical protein
MGPDAIEPTGRVRRAGEGTPLTDGGLVRLSWARSLLQRRRWIAILPTIAARQGGCMTEFADVETVKGWLKYHV